MNQDCPLLQKEEEIMKRLQEPFPLEDLEWRVQRATMWKNKPYAIVVPYVTNRAIQTRLDEVVGPFNWKNEYSLWRNDGVLCGISIKVNGEWITKYDGADAGSIEATKSGFSNSSKRSAVVWGIGRYLYGLNEYWVEIQEQKAEHRFNGKVKHDKKETYMTGYWKTPSLPEWALPQSSQVSNSNPNPSFQQQKEQRPNQSSTTGNQISQQKDNGFSQTSGTQNRTDSQQHDLSKHVNYVRELENILKLEKNIYLQTFNEVNNTNFSNCNLIYTRATFEQLMTYYKCLKPVADVTLLAEHHDFPINEIVRFAQIIKPQQPLLELSDLLGVVTKEDVREIELMAEAEAFERKRENHVPA
jgi:hypothetical protein